MTGQIHEALSVPASVLNNFPTWAATSVLLDSVPDSAAISDAQEHLSFDIFIG